MLVGFVLLAVPAGAQTPKVFPPPGRTSWVPEGCRTVGSSNPVLASRAAWRSLHGDEANTDEVSIAYAPVFQADWVAEPFTWNPTGPRLAPCSTVQGTSTSHRFVRTRTWR